MIGETGERKSAVATPDGKSRKKKKKTRGGRGSRAAVCFFKLLLIVHCDFEKVSQDQQFQSTLSVGRGSQKKSTLCTLLIMLTILDDPLGTLTRHVMPSSLFQ